MKRILVCGGRDFDRWNIFVDAMNAIGLDNFEHEHITIICGDARGADRMAMEWAAVRDIPFERYKADWDNLGKKAGYCRNLDMLKAKPELVVAFPGGIGTKMMTNMAKRGGIRVIEIKITPDGFTYGEKTSDAIDVGAEEYEAIMVAMESMHGSE